VLTIEGIRGLAAVGPLPKRVAVLDAVKGNALNQDYKGVDSTRTMWGKAGDGPHAKCTATSELEIFAIQHIVAAPFRQQLIAAAAGAHRQMIAFRDDIRCYHRRSGFRLMLGSTIETPYPSQEHCAVVLTEATNFATDLAAPELRRCENGETIRLSSNVMRRIASGSEEITIALGADPRISQATTDTHLHTEPMSLKHYGRSMFRLQSTTVLNSVGCLMDRHRGMREDGARVLMSALNPRLLRHQPPIGVHRSFLTLHPHAYAAITVKSLRSCGMDTPSVHRLLNRSGMNRYEITASTHPETFDTMKNWIKCADGNRSATIDLYVSPG
jgi:hypothetical protein